MASKWLPTIIKLKLSFDIMFFAALRPQESCCWVPPCYPSKSPLSGLCNVEHSEYIHACSIHCLFNAFHLSLVQWPSIWILFNSHPVEPCSMALLLKPCCTAFTVWSLLWPVLIEVNLCVSVFNIYAVPLWADLLWCQIPVISSCP